MIAPVSSAAPEALAPRRTAPTTPPRSRTPRASSKRLLIGQMMKSMRDSEGGWLGTGDDEASSSAMEYAQEMFAQSLSANGGLGMASLVMKGLKPPDEP